MHTVYIDRLSFFSLIALITSKINYSHIFYFNSTPYGGNIAKFFLLFKLLRAKPQYVDFHFGDLRYDSGEYRVFKILDDTVF